MHNFIVFSLSRWNIEYGCNIRDISIELAQNNKVVYVDVPLKRKERWFKKDAKFVKEVEERIASGDNLRLVSPNLWHYIADEVLESVNGISNNTMFDAINLVNNKRLAKVIQKAAAQAGFQSFILINDNDIYNGYHLARLVRPELYVYYLRDRLPAMAYWKAHTGRLEPDLIRSSDVVTANSQYLADYAKQFNPHSYYVGQGCDVTAFLERPALTGGSGIDELARPLIGYIGALNSERLDISLIAGLANRMPDCNFVLVGQEDEAFRQSSLHGISNIFFTGRKDFNELPALLYSFDCVINPQLTNEITIGNYPRKVDEYLAAGKPVVATETRAMQPFENHVYLASTPESYIQAIRRALQEDNVQKQEARRAFASEHTWPNNVHEMMNAINTVLNEKLKQA